MPITGDLEEGRVLEKASWRRTYKLRLDEGAGLAGEDRGGASSRERAVRQEQCWAGKRLAWWGNRKVSVVRGDWSEGSLERNTGPVSTEPRRTWGVFGTLSQRVWVSFKAITRAAMCSSLGC